MFNTKPDIVNKAQLILWSTLAIGVVRHFLDFPRLSQQAAAVGGSLFVHSVAAFTLVTLGLIFYFLGKRKNWARWLFVILLVLGLPFSIYPLIQSLSSDPVSGVLGLIQEAAQVCAGVFLFSAPARSWYGNQSD